MNEDRFEDRLPEELQRIAAALSAHRDVGDGHLLERVLRRVKSSPNQAPHAFARVKMRVAGVAILIFCFALNMTGAMAAVLSAVGLKSNSSDFNLLNLLSSLDKHTSTGTGSQSAADEVYCEDQGQGGQSDVNGQGGSEANGGGSEANGGNNSSTVKTTDGTNQGSETNGQGSESNGQGSESNGGGQGQCCPPGQTGGGSEANGGGSEANGGGSEANGVHDSSKIKSADGTNQGGSENNGQGSESNGGGGGGQCSPPPCTPSGSDVNDHSGSEANGGDKSSTIKTNGTNQSDSEKNGGSESNGGQCPPPPPEKPGCGNEHNIGISGNSGAHGGQPPKKEERGDCPHSPGVDGN